MASSEKKTSRAESLYRAVKEMAIQFKFRPGERVNEVELARRLGASRTPLREALTRLTAEGFLVFRQDRGFFCRELKPREMFEIYQLRAVLEVAAVRLACEQATEREVDELAEFLERTGPREDGRGSEELVELDEYFHTRVMQLSRNAEMEKTLDNINARIRYFRWVNMEQKREQTQNEHRQIVQAIMDRDSDLAAHRMEAHISRRLDQITSAIKESHSRLRIVDEN